jgi:CRP-like cAMP-binding protein
VAKEGRSIELLRDIWLFAQCTDRELDAVATLATRLDYPAATELAREGDSERGFFVIVSGTSEVRRNGTLLATLEAGDFFGEMAILEHDVQVATVTTVTPTTVLAMTRAGFATMTETMPSITAEMLVAMARRLRAVENQYVPVARQFPRRSMVSASQ